MVKIRFEQTLSFHNVRQLRGITLMEAARSIGVPVNDLNRYESNIGEMPLDIALSLLKLYGLPSNTLVFKSYVSKN